MYALMIDTYIKDKKQQTLLNAIENIPCITKKASWVMNGFNLMTHLQKIIAFAIVEGIFFSKFLCNILAKRNLMPGLICLMNLLPEMKVCILILLVFIFQNKK